MCSLHNLGGGSQALGQDPYPLCRGKDPSGSAPPAEGPGNGAVDKKKGTAEDVLFHGRASGRHPGKRHADGCVDKQRVEV